MYYFISWREMHCFEVPLIFSTSYLVGTHVSPIIVSLVNLIFNSCLIRVPFCLRDYVNTLSAHHSVIYSYFHPFIPSTEIIQ